MQETQTIAEQAVGYHTSDLPEDVILMAHLALIDTQGCAIRGSQEPLTRILSEELFGRAVQPHNFLPGACLTSVPSNQAMLYASSAHAIDFDDTFPPAMAAHTGGSVFGALAALSPHVSGTGEDFLAAVVAGYETAARIGQLLTTEHYLKGFHPTATVGVFGAAAAAGRVMGFNVDQMKQTLGMAATQAAGLKCVFGTMTKPFNSGHAAASGLLAARLVARGFTAPKDAVEAEKGYLDMFMGLAEEDRKVEGPETFFILENAFKLHAACHATHPMIEAILALKGEHEFSGDDVEKVVVATAEIGARTASIQTPTTGLECKFSYPQVAAATLYDYDPAADETYSDAILNETRVNNLRSLVEIETSLEEAFNTRVELTLKSGQVLAKDLNYVELMKDKDFLLPRLEAKFDANVGPVLGDDTAVKLRKLLLHVSSVSSLKEAAFRFG